MMCFERNLATIIPARLRDQITRHPSGSIISLKTCKVGDQRHKFKFYYGGEIARLVNIPLLLTVKYDRLSPFCTR